MTADWLNASATLVATLAALFAGVIAFRAHRREQRRLEHDRERECRLTAEGVNAWLVSGKREGAPSVCIVLQNRSSMPVYDVQVEVTLGGRPVNAPSKDRWLVVPPGRYIVFQRGNGSWQLPEPFLPEHQRYVPYTRTEQYLVTRLELTDPAGQAWARDARGSLSMRDGDTSSA